IVIKSPNPLRQRPSSSEVHPSHRAPPRPIMITSVAPDVQFVADAARPQNAGELLIAVPAHVVLARSEDGPHVVVLPPVRAICQIVGRIVEIDIFAVPAIEELPDVEVAAHANAPVHHVRVTEGEVDGVISAEAAPSDGGVGCPILVPHQWEDIVDDVALVLQVALHAPVGMRPTVVPALLVNAVHAINLHFAGFNAIADRLNHLVVFVLKKTSARRWEDQDLASSVT